MTAPGEALALLGATPLFAGVASADLEPLLADFRLRRFAADSYIFREGDPGDHMHLVTRGEVKISRTTEAGSEVVFAVLGAGDVFGELAVLQENATRSADAQALAETECYVLHRQAVVAFLVAHPAVMWRLVTVLSDYIRRKDEAYSDLAFNDIPGRVARKLLELAAARGGSGAEAHVTVPLSQRTLAGLVGASRENVNRALSRFAALGAIKLERGRVTVLRPEELRRRSL
ncbi:MAG: Crp/Fnr family transcriptional regulator [Chloroflexi bacterium]|nr:MAG: Crp/Fnr family transcriptional regulator [Chloroflexota bacterium]